MLARVLMPLLVAMTSYAQSAFGQKTISFFQEPTLPLPGRAVIAYTFDFSDSLSSDTLYQVRAGNGFPVSYHRKIRTSVCFDNKCRLLDVIVHWNPTGRYEGFELPPGEFLSKTEHEPFNNDEYLRLHAILDDPNSPLAGLSFNQLVPSRPRATPDIDAVSAPTARNLLEFVVEGAAYTTYKLWHIVYGEAHEEVSKLTEAALTAGMLEEILRSAHIVDQVWGLTHRHVVQETTPGIQAAILGFATSDEFTLSHEALEAVQRIDLDADFQSALLEVFSRLSHAAKKQALEAFLKAPDLTKESTLKLAGILKSASGDLVSSILRLLEKKNVNDEEVLVAVAALLEKSNAYIATQAFEFLSGKDIQNPKIQKSLKAFESRQTNR